MSKQIAVPPMLPRERLTAKAKAAIRKYVAIKSQGKLRITYFLVDWTLEAERMRRKDLYALLDSRGYRWVSTSGVWIHKGNKVL